MKTEATYRRIMLKVGSSAHSCETAPIPQLPPSSRLPAADGEGDVKAMRMIALSGRFFPQSKIAFMSDRVMSVLMFFCSALNSWGALAKPFTVVALFLLVCMMSCCRLARPKSDDCSGWIAFRDRAT